MNLSPTNSLDKILCPQHLTLTSLAIVALGTVSFISRGMTGSHDVGRSLTGGPFLEPARRNVAEFDLCRGGGGACVLHNSDKRKKLTQNMKAYIMYMYIIEFK